jgi:hypothetical protein
MMMSQSMMMMMMMVRITVLKLIRFDLIRTREGSLNGQSSGSNTTSTGVCPAVIVVGVLLSRNAANGGE